MAAAEKTAGATDNFEAFTTINPDTFKEGYEKLSEGVTALADFQKSTYEAILASANVFYKGVEKVATDSTAFTKTAMEEGVEATKAATSSKNIQEVFEANNQFVQSTVEKNLGQINKMADLWIETSKKAAEPLTARYNEFVELVQSYRP